MASDEYDISMQGRILALEVLMRNVLADRIGAIGGDPKTDAETFKSDLLASLQNLHRPVDEHSDRVWEAASDAVRSTLDQVIYRLSQGLGRRAQR